METFEKDFKEFLLNPQVKGCWQLRIEFDKTSLQNLLSILNLSDGSYSRIYYGNDLRYRSTNKYLAYSEREIPPVIIPRLFAYLRGSLSKKDRELLPSLLYSKEFKRRLDLKYPAQRRFYSYIGELLTIPSNLSLSKKRKLSKALKIYKESFEDLSFYSVGGSNSIVDCIGRRSQTYFQTFEELPNAIKILSALETTLLDMQKLLESLPEVNFKIELTKVYSPESFLMEMYVPILKVIPIQQVIKDSKVIKVLLQSMEEINEDRYAHSIRAIGIGTEELLVEIYETYLHEKAPEKPLGNLLDDFNKQLYSILYGKELALEGKSILNTKKNIGAIIDNEKSKPKKNENLISLLIELQTSIVPNIEEITQKLSINLDPISNNQKIHLFPNFVYRNINELIALRNKVSHRVEKSSLDTSTIGYIEAATALRALIVLSYWWQGERSLINYRQDRKKIISETLKRSKNNS